MSATGIRRAVSSAIIILSIDSGFCRDAIAQVPEEKAVVPPKASRKNVPIGKVTIKAKNYDYSGDILTADGDVSVVDGDMTLTADLIKVKMKTGPDNKSTYEKVTAIGKTSRVVLKSLEGTAIGQQIDYDVAKGIAILSGKAEITFRNGGRLFGADKIMLNRTQQKIWTVGGSPRAIIPSNEKNNSSLKGLLGTKDAEQKKEEKPKPKKNPETPKAPTEISATGITNDMTKGIIEFKGNVHVIQDDEMDLKSDTLKVYRNKEGKATRILADGGTGRVFITNPQGKADGPKADYNLITGILELSGKANLTTTNGMQFKNADKVTYDRAKNDFSAQGGTIDIASKNGTSLKSMFQNENGKKNDPKNNNKPAKEGNTKRLN